MINKIAELHERLSGETLKGGITPDDAGKVLSQCITCPTELPIVSSRSLFIMLEEARFGYRGAGIRRHKERRGKFPAAYSFRSLAWCTAYTG